MVITVDFKEDFIKRAISDNYGIPEEDVNIKKYSSVDILESVTWYLRSGEGQGVELHSVAKVRPSSIMSVDILTACENSDGEIVKGTEERKTILYNNGVISDEELDRILENDTFMSDERIIVTTPARAENVSTISRFVEDEQERD